MEEYIGIVADKLKNWLIDSIPSLVSAIIIVIVGWWVTSLISRFIFKIMKRSRLDDSITFFLNSILKVALKTFVILSGLAVLGVNITSVVAAVGAAGITAGLALKGTLTNVASGVILILHRPFEVGDYLELCNIEGNVVKIDIIFTTLTTIDNKTVMIPNSTVASGNIINYSKQGTRRLDLIFSIGLRDNVDVARKIITEELNKNDMIINKNATEIVVESNSFDSVDIGVKVWCQSKNYLKLKYALLEDLKKALEENGIYIPYKQLDIHMAQ